ncbi:unnamed protein product, partial [Iphiclides podalirius]
MEDIRLKHKSIQNAAHHIAMECIHPQFGLFLHVCTNGMHSRRTAPPTTFTLFPLLSVYNMRSQHRTARKCFIQRDSNLKGMAKLLSHQLRVLSLGGLYVLHPVEAHSLAVCPT